MTNSGRPFRVPWALDTSGGLVQVSASVAGTPYWCPGCRVPLVLKDGSIRAKHFAHQVSNSCSQESAIHNAAKIRIMEVVKNWLNGQGAAPMITGPCKGTNWWYCDGSADRSLLNGKVDEVLLETQVGELRPDVLLLLRGKPVLGIEILLTHEVDDAKRSKADYPWIELNASDVLQNPLVLIPTQHNIPKLDLCDLCAHVNISAMNLRIDRIAAGVYRWIDTARNPDAARHSLLFGGNCLRDRIWNELVQERRKAIARWRKAHSGEPPDWGNYGDTIE